MAEPEDGAMNIHKAFRYKGQDVVPVNGPGGTVGWLVKTFLPPRAYHTPEEAKKAIDDHFPGTAPRGELG